MRSNLKGGVWKNTEDEILKVAVMKYGLNQWSRISSLLTRKSPAQCKARWYEWLDPSIKKTDWSKEEEEKLLHLAKIFPSQWKTIGPLVGRTSAQCLEHYNKLLDAVQQDTIAEGEATGEEARRLRQGEIEVNPETKPAKPDPVDMDEDEKESLSEAKARLSNTHGKKEKRKFREKQLEEARRLAFLQKKRELKAAGIILKDTSNKKEKRFDYSQEIPFYKKPAAGFYDTSGESKVDPNKDQEFIHSRLDKLEQDKSRAAQEAANKLAEQKKKEKELMNLPQLIKQISQDNDINMSRARTKLVLPAPQLTDEDLEEIAEFEKANSKMTASGSSNSATNALVGGFKVPSATPFHQQQQQHSVARTPLREDTIMQEAKNLLAMTNAQTPLKGGVNPNLSQSDFSGVTPKSSALTQRTPNPVRTPNTLKTDRMGMSSASSSSSIAATPNRAGFGAESESLSSQLNRLPKPVNEYDVSLPDEEPSIEEEEDNVPPGGVLDESEKGIRADQEYHHKQQYKLRNRSSTMKKSLPRSTISNKQLESRLKDEAPKLIFEEMEKGIEKDINQLLINEMNNIIINDNNNFPLNDEDNNNDNQGSSYEIFNNKEIQIATTMLTKEMELMDREWRGDKMQDQEQENQDRTKYIQEFVNRWDKVRDSFVYVSEKEGYVEQSKVTKEQTVARLNEQYTHIINSMKSLSKKAMVLEKKVTTDHAIYVQRHQSTCKSIEQLAEDISQSSIELSCFRALAVNEHRALESRVKHIEQLVYDQCDRENALQMRYSQLLSKKQSLLLKSN